MIGSRRRAFQLCAAAAVLAAGLWFVAGRGGRGTRSPVRTERAHPVSAVPLRNNGPSVDLAPSPGAESGDPRAVRNMERASEADVRPPVPPEAFLPVLPETRAPDRDTGLVFGPPPGGPTTETKPLHPSDVPAASSGEIQPAAAADVRPPPDPAIFLPAPPRTEPDRDTGLVFRSEPRATDPGDKR